jgi:hypothetical protein
MKEPNALEMAWIRAALANKKIQGDYFTLTTRAADRFRSYGIAVRPDDTATRSELTKFVSRKVEEFLDSIPSMAFPGFKAIVSAVRRKGETMAAVDIPGERRFFIELI